MLSVYAAVKCVAGGVGQWDGRPVILQNIFIGVDSKLYGSHSRAAMNPREQGEKEAFMLRTKDRQGIQI